MSEPDEVKDKAAAVAAGVVAEAAAIAADVVAEAASAAADVVNEAADAATEGANADEEFPYGRAPNVEHPA